MFGHDWLVFIVHGKPCRTHVFDDKCCPPHMMDHQSKIDYYMATIQYVNTSYHRQLQDLPNP